LVQTFPNLAADVGTLKDGSIVYFFKRAQLMIGEVKLRKKNINAFLLFLIKKNVSSKNY
jgi:hypothetical protein